MKQPGKILYLEELIKSNYPNLALWQFDLQGNLLYPDTPAADLFYDMFKRSGCLELCLDYMRTYKDGHTSDSPNGYLRPVMLTDMFDLIWIAAFRSNKEIINDIYMVGPALVSETSKSKLVQSLVRHHFTKELNDDVYSIFDQIARVPATTMYLYSSMLHFTITGSPLPDYLPATLAVEDEPRAGGVSQSLYRSSYLDWQKQEILMKHVEEGNLRYQDSLDLAIRDISGNPQKTLSPLRWAKDSLIAFISLCAEAAVRGGLSPASSFYMRDTYITQVEKTATYAQLMNLNHAMYDHYVQCVHESKSQAAFSNAVRCCRDYISLHICEKISIAELASLAGYSDYYLSRKFKEETGMNILTYINKQKIEYAKKLLTTTDDSVQSISDALQFCARSHFSSMFKRHTGMLPREYREKNSRL